jgi:hypothetical protein
MGHCKHEQCCVPAEPRSDCGELPGEAEIELPARDEAPAGDRQHAHRIGVIAATGRPTPWVT